MSDLEERLAALRQRAIDDAAVRDVPTWRPERDGDELAGLVVHAGTATVGEEGREVARVVVERPDGSREALFGSGVVLSEAIEEANPQPGDLLCAIYLGEGISRAGRAFKRFGLSVEPADGKRTPPRTGAGAPPPGDEDVPFAPSRV